MRKISKRSFAVVTGVAVTMAGTGLAYAYWTSGGSGSGSAATGTTQGITINQLSTVTNLSPGATPQALSGDFDNANSSSVYVGSVTAVVASTDKPLCDVSNYQINGTAPVNSEIPSGNGVGSWSGLTIKMLDTAVNQDACKNAVVSIAYSSS